MLSLCLTAQNLCDASKNPNYLANGFKFVDGNTGCGPFTVKLEDKSGGTNVKYIYLYHGQRADSLKYLAPTAETENPYFNPAVTSNYTILQYGKDAAGKDFHSCGNVVVRAGSKPKFSYTICTRGVEIVIPKHLDNKDYTSFQIILQSASILKTINASQLPFSESFTINYPEKLEIIGLINGLPDNCSSVKESLEKLDPARFPNGFDVPYDINIDTLTLVEPDRVRLSFKGSLEPKGYTLQMREGNGDYPSIPILENVIPGSIELNIPKPENSYCFKLSRRAGCGSYEFSSEICTIPITQSSIDRKGKTIIKWVNHPTLSTSQTISQKKELTISKVNIGIERKQLLNNLDTFEDFMSCGVFKVCYKINNSISGKYYDYKYKSVSISNEVCLTTDSILAPPLTNIYTSIENERVEINYEPIENWPTEIESYYLFQKLRGSFELIDSSLNNASIFYYNPNELNDSYCFALGYKDKCGIQSELSNTICTIHLSDSSSLGLSWTNKSPFGNSTIESFEILAQNEFSMLFEVVGNITNESYFIPNLENFEDNALFKVRAISSEGVLSYSNLIPLPLKFEIFIPTVFSPNQDGFNDAYKIYGNLDKVKEFRLIIVDRNGFEIYSSEKPKFEWDPFKINPNFSSGVYNYVIALINSENELLNYSGQLYILK